MECLRMGAHVVSTCEELAYPFRKHPELSAHLDRCARDNKVALLGVGVNPGFAMDKLVLTLASVCHQVTRVEVHRVVDASRRRLPLQRKVGAGLTVEEFNANVATGAIKHHGLPESLAMIADALGAPVERIEETIEPVIATQHARFESIEIPAGRVLGVHQVARGLRDGSASVSLELHMYLGAAEPTDTIRIHGVPDMNLQIPGGIHGDLATTAVVVNCIPAVLEARPGLRTAKDIPMCYFPGLLALS
jgi:4-hydroxy-tetrahydrodipicolinate reductase